MTWRQHRATLLTFAALVGIVIAMFVFTWDDLRGCLTQSTGCHANTPLLNLLQGVPTFLPLLPALIAAFLGAPLLARELEQGTYRFAWTQGVSRGRWLLAKLALLASAVVLLGVAFAVVYRWWYPVSETRSWLMPLFGFDVGLLVFPVYCLLGFALGAVAGAVIRRTLPAMAVGFAAFLALTWTVRNYLRPNFLSPVQEFSPAFGPNRPRYGGWWLDGEFVDRNGGTLDWLEADLLINSNQTTRLSAAEQVDAAAKAGLRYRETYHPSDRFWTFQFMEAGLFLLLIAGCVVLTLWWTRRRLA